MFNWNWDIIDWILKHFLFVLLAISRWIRYVLCNLSITSNTTSYPSLIFVLPGYRWTDLLVLLLLDLWTLYMILILVDLGLHVSCIYDSSIIDIVLIWILLILSRRILERLSFYSRIWVVILIWFIRASLQILVILLFWDPWYLSFLTFAFIWNHFLFIGYVDRIITTINFWIQIISVYLECTFKFVSFPLLAVKFTWRWLFSILIFDTACRCKWSLQIFLFLSGALKIAWHRVFHEIILWSTKWWFNLYWVKIASLLEWWTHLHVIKWLIPSLTMTLLE